MNVIIMRDIAPKSVANHMSDVQVFKKGTAKAYVVFIINNT